MTEKAISIGFQSLDLRNPIQVRTGDYRRKWVDAKVVYVRAEHFPADEHEYDLPKDECTRIGLSFSVEFEGGGEKFEQHLADAFGWSGDNWRYKEKCCEQCKFVDTVGGDVVPYGATTATTPEGYICECPDMPEDIGIPYDETNGGRECKYFVSAV